MACAFCEQTRRFLARILARGRGRHVPQSIPINPVATADALVLRCCDPRHSTHLIEGAALVSASYNLGSPALNEGKARADGWQRRTEGWICGICAARR
jgi:hypothetical protein